MGQRERERMKKRLGELDQLLYRGQATLGDIQRQLGIDSDEATALVVLAREQQRARMKDDDPELFELVQYHGQHPPPCESPTPSRRSRPLAAFLVIGGLASLGALAGLSWLAWRAVVADPGAPSGAEAPHETPRGSAVVPTATPDERVETPSGCAWALAIEARDPTLRGCAELSWAVSRGTCAVPDWVLGLGGNDLENELAIYCEHLFVVSLLPDDELAGRSGSPVVSSLGEGGGR